jgi:hypothetical protein
MCRLNSSESQSLRRLPSSKPPEERPCIEAVNDFVVKFANINGSGSASANELFARAILRMGVPVSPRNIFPSNIQGLPTWYEVRVTEHGYLGRRGGVDMMVAMNPADLGPADVREIEPGGYLFYDNDQAVAASKSDRPARERRRQASATASSSTAIPPRRWAASMAAPRSARGIRSRRRRRWPKPSRSLRRSCASTRNRQRRYAIVQAEDELASIGMVIGAGWNGARAFTATSGPGISLMTEFIGLAYFAEIPAVLINVQRGGPSTGMPTRTQQADLLACAYASHGDTKHVLLLPEDPYECFEMSAAGARPRRAPADAGVRHDRPRHRHEPAPVRPFAWDDAREYDRGKVMTPNRARRRCRFRPLPRRRRRRHPLSHLSGHAPDQGRLLHPRHTKNAYAATPSRRRLRLQHAAAAAQVRDRQVAGAAAGAHRPLPGALRRHLLSARPARRCTRRSTRSPNRASTSTPCACAPFPFQNESPTSSPRTKVFVLEQNRDAQTDTLLVNEAGVESGEPDPGAALRRHADHRALHRARRSPNARHA